MGNDNSTPLLAPPADFEFCSISFCGRDTIRILPSNADAVEAVRSAVLARWSPQIQKEVTHHEICVDIKLNGTPFSIGGSVETAMIARELSCQILTNLYAIGWQIVVCSDLSRESERTTWIFQNKTQQQHSNKREPQLAGRLENVCCLSISSSDSLHLINASSTALHDTVLAACQSVYSHGIQMSSVSESGDFCIKLRGSPWLKEFGQDLIDGRNLILEVVQRFASFGYQLFATCDLKGKADSLYFSTGCHSSCSVVRGESKQQRFMAISLDRGDRLRFLRSNDAVLSAARDVIGREWPKGIAREEDKYGSWELKLGGSPWWSYGVEAIASRRMLMRLLQRLEQLGWSVQSAVDLTRSDKDKTMFVMSSAAEPISKEYICCAPSDVDKLNVIGAEQELIDLIEKVLELSYPKGIRKSGWVHDRAAYQWKFNGQPWVTSYGSTALHSRNMMIHLLKALLDLGWSLVTSCDTSSKYQTDNDGHPLYPIDVHSWILSRQIIID